MLSIRRATLLARGSQAPARTSCGLLPLADKVDVLLAGRNRVPGIRSTVAFGLRSRAVSLHPPAHFRLLTYLVGV